MNSNNQLANNEKTIAGGTTEQDLNVTNLTVSNLSHFNYGGTNNSGAQIRVSPGSLNGEASASFYKGPQETSTRWSVGQGAGGVGGGNFGLWNSSKGTTMSSSESTGICNFPFGVSLYGGAPLTYYDEGSFTPTVIGLPSNPTGLTTTIATGYYTRFGNMVSIQYFAKFDYNNGTPNLYISITLPFPIDSAKSSASCGVCNADYTNVSLGTCMIRYRPSVLGVTFWTVSGEQDIQFDYSSTPITGSQVAGSFTYFC